MRPISFGKPPSSFFHVRPPSVERKTPPRSLPDVCVHGVRLNFHIAA